MSHCEIITFCVAAIFAKFYGSAERGLYRSCNIGSWYWLTFNHNEIHTKPQQTHALDNKCIYSNFFIIKQLEYKIAINTINCWGIWYDTLQLWSVNETSLFVLISWIFFSNINKFKFQVHIICTFVLKLIKSKNLSAFENISFFFL